ncbi:MAG: glycosyltransferase family 4 protein [Candidatus Micrarchaeaceae archaeon]
MIKPRVLVMDLGSRTNIFGGEARIASILYRGLKEYFETSYLGYETEYIKAGKDTIMLSRGAKSWQGPAVKKRGLSENWFMRFGYFFLMGRNMLDMGIEREKLAKKVKLLSPDIVISNSVWDFSTLRYIKGYVDFKTIFIDHACISNSNAPGYLSKTNMPLTLGTGIFGSSIGSIKSKFFRYFDACVALSKVQLKEISKFTDKVYYIPNGLDINTKHDRKAEERLRERYGLGSSNFIILYLGRMFERQKNVSTLIKAFMRLKGRRLRLLLVGGGQSVTDYIKLASKDRRIIFTGEVPEESLPHLYNISNLFVLPSAWEGSNLTIIEAAAHGLPIIISDNAYSDDLKDPSIGKLVSFKTFNSNDLADKIAFMLSHKSAMNAAIASSRKIAKRFTERSMLKRYYSLISRLVR